MTDTSACGRIQFRMLWCWDCVSLIRSRFRDQVFDQVSTFGFGLPRSYRKNKDTNYECDQPVSGNFINCGALLAIALQKSAFKSIAVHLPIPNWRPVDLYVSPVTNHHNATATRFFTGMHSHNQVSFFAKSGPTNRTMHSNVRLDILKFSFHHSSTKFPFNRVWNQNWFLGHDHTRLTRLVLRRAICSRINRFRLDLFRCYKSKSCCNLDCWVYWSRTRK